MRQIATTRKKLRGIPRRLRALDRWADTFTVFYDAGYYAGFMHEHNALAPRSLAGSLGLALPEGFVESGCDITQPEDAQTVELWCIGERI